MSTLQHVEVQLKGLRSAIFIHFNPMSRALDPKVKESLKQGDHTAVYQCVADVLSTRHQELLDIEVLGPSHPLPEGSVLLREDNAIAIPKLNILRAFLPAYSLFKKHLKCQNGVSEEIMRATSVILLLDPEHMTAANVRKRYIQRIKEMDPENIDEALDKELYFTDSLLTSRLHRHTKSPTLWGHRQWLMELRLESPRPICGLAVALEELIFVSAERHPRNYYAWCHARYLLGLAVRTGPVTANDGDVPAQQQQRMAALENITNLVKRWCFSHNNDISGWSFLVVLVEQRPRTAAPALFSETLHLAETFSWRGESVWYFLRNMLRRDWLHEAHAAEFDRVLRLVFGKVAEAQALEEGVMGSMLEWSRLYSELGADGTRD